MRAPLGHFPVKALREPVDPVPLEGLAVQIWKEILVVDDSKVFREMMTTVMEPYAGQVHTASGAAEAKAVIDRAPGLGLVLSDVVMADGSGFDVLEHVQAKPEPRPPVILVTAFPREESIERALQLGALDFLSKPTTIRRVLRSFEHRGLPDPSDRDQPRWRSTGRAMLVDPDADAGAFVCWDIYNLSPSGAFLETKGPVPVGTVLDLRLELGAQRGQVRARVVRVQHPSWIDVGGVGVVFEDVDEGARAILDGLEAEGPPH